MVTNTCEMISPSGAIPRVERQQTHYEFLWGVRPPYAMVDLTHGARIAAVDQRFFPPETDIILTSTISDEDLARYTFIDELRIVRNLDPDYYLPFDFPVYGDMDPEKRTEFIEQVATGTRDMDYLLGDIPMETVESIAKDLNVDVSLIEKSQDTEIIPLIKGTTAEERNTMLEVATDIDAPCIAKYGVQYMTVSGSGNYPALNETLHAIHQESDGYPLLVIGLLSPTGRYSLEHVPDNVIGGAGLNQWKKRINVQNDSVHEYRQSYIQLNNEVCDVLNIETEYVGDESNVPNYSVPAQFENNQGYGIDDELSITITGAADEGGYGFGQRKRPPDSLSASEAGLRGGLKRS